jgi:hypothetical protein
VVIDRQSARVPKRKLARCFMSQTGQQMTFERGQQREAAMASLS